MSVKHLKLSDYSLDIPADLIAQHPLDNRSASRLMVANATGPGSLQHHHFGELVGLLNPGDLLVLNNTQVIPARLFGKKASGGSIEIMVERLLPPNQLLAKVRASKPPKPETSLILDSGVELKVDSRDGEFYRLSFAEGVDPMVIVQSDGNVPLPPYIKRAADEADRDRYQTIYGQKPGAVAAPTAGLHFDQALFDDLSAAGINRCFVTLHVGAGTFQPIRVEDPAEHVMHAEFVEVNPAAVEAVNKTRQEGGRIIAVGTTSIRCLETAARASIANSTDQQTDQQTLALEPFSGDTRLFITPGDTFHIVDGLLTNFHLPQSTLLMLVAAFAGHAEIMHAYQEAIAQQYRFYSYGDAMLLWPQAAPE